jgi:hypothetical protein
VRVLRLSPFAMATVLAVALGSQVIAGSALAAAGSAEPAGGDTVTLLSGDRVHVGGGSASRSMRLEPAPGREKMRFAVENTGGHVYVVPADAFRVVGVGRVDRRLFDVTGLAAHGFDDADRDYLPLVSGNRPPGRGAAATKLRLPKRDANRYWTEIVRGGTSVRLDVATAPVGSPSPTADDVTVTLRVLGRDGKATPDYFLTLQNYAGGETLMPYDPSGRVKVSVPAGLYVISSTTNGVDGSTSALVQPWADLRQDADITFDARTTQPVEVTVAHPSATMMHGVVQHYAATADGVADDFVWGSTFENFFIGHVGAAAPPGRFAATVTTHFADPTNANFADSPYRYNVAFSQRDTMFDGFRRHLTLDDFATVNVRYSNDGPPNFPQSHAVTSGPVGFTPTILLSYPIGLTPGLNPRRTEYFAGDSGVRWNQDWGRGNPISQEWEGGEVSPWQQFAAGHKYDLRWSAAVIGPGFTHDGFSDDASRRGETMRFALPMFSPGIAGFWGASIAPSRTVLSRDGTVIGETANDRPGEAVFSVPAGAGTYRLDVHASRALYEFSSGIDASWTFPSGPVAPGLVEPLPLMSVRFSPAFNNRNQAPAGIAFDLPIWLDRVDGTDNSTRVDLSLDVSYDDGATWQRATVQRTATGWTARLIHPAAGTGAGYVSLRASAADGAGSSVTQTIIHAYGLTPAKDAG